MVTFCTAAPVSPMVGGSSAGYDFGIAGARIGGLALPVTEAGYSTNTTGALASDVFTTLVGNLVWEHFVLILDLKGNKLYLKQ